MAPAVSVDEVTDAKALARFAELPQALDGDDGEVAAALLAAAERWLAAGYEWVIAPLTADPTAPPEAVHRPFARRL